jgi:hypothetical protein
MVAASNASATGLMCMSDGKHRLFYPTNKLLAFIAGLLSLAFLPAAAQYTAFEAKPWSYLSSICIITNLIVVMVIFFTPILVIGRDLKAWTLRIAVVVLAFIALKLGAQLGREIMRSNYLKVAEHSKPLIAAIEKFDQDNGHPPAQLADLVPAYLKVVPKTGVGANWDFIYEVGTGHRWKLFIYRPLTGFDATEFYYYPGISKDYPYQPIGDYHRVLDWVYR